MSGLMSDVDLLRFYNTIILPFLCNIKESKAKQLELVDMGILTKIEILRCECEIKVSVENDILNWLNVDIDYIFDNLKNDSIILFNILKKLSIPMDTIYNYSLKYDVLNAYMIIFLLTHEYSNETIIQSLIYFYGKGLSDSELTLLKYNLTIIYKYLNSSNNLSKNLEIIFLDIIKTSYRKIDIKKYFNVTKYKVLFLYKFRNDKRYRDELVEISLNN
jgi:hypothetical protein